MVAYIRREVVSPRSKTPDQHPARCPNGGARHSDPGVAPWSAVWLSITKVVNLLVKEGCAGSNPVWVARRIRVEKEYRRRFPRRVQIDCPGGS